MQVDTSREAVERLAQDMTDPCSTIVSRLSAAATLRALLSERDAATARARRETWGKAAEIVHGAYLLWACGSSYEAHDKASALSDAEAAIRSAAAGEEGKP